MTMLTAFEGGTMRCDAYSKQFRPWFAWYPVRIHRHWVWLQWIARIQSEGKNAPVRYGHPRYGISDESGGT